MPTRRSVLGGLAASPLLAPPFLAPGTAAAQDAFPSRALLMLVGYAPGGGTDIVARMLAPFLQARLGQPVAVENRPGASGTLASSAVARSKPDGYSLVMGTITTQAVVAPMMRPPPYDVLGDFTPLALAGTVPLVVMVPKDAPYKTFGELIDYARKHPGKLNYASSGIATQQHLSAEMLSQAAGISMTHVPYRGTGQVVNDLLAGTIDLAIDTLPTHLPHIRSGASRALAVSTAQRAPVLPDLPTIAESGFPGFQSVVWYMMLGPANMPKPVVDRLSQAMMATLAEPEIRRKLEETGYLPGGGTPEDAANLVRADAERYAALVQKAGVRID